MAIAALLLVDLGMRASDLKVMYTDDGMFPRGLIRHHYTSLWYWSLHFASGSWGYQAMLFVIAALFAFALLIGFKTRWAVIGSWLLLISVQHRVPPILSGADILFRMLLFWAMFLPLERAWSVDRCLSARPGGGDNGRVLSVASAAILLQIGLVYLFSAIFKSNMVWVSGEAIAGILAHDFYASRLGGSLLQFPKVLSGITWATFFLEWLSPLLLFFPKYTAAIRLGVVAALVAMHAGIAACLMVDLFSLVALAGLTLFLPAEFWNSRLLARFSRASERFPSRPDAEKYFAHARASLASVAQDICLLFLIYVIALNIDTLPGRPLAWLALEKWKPLTMGCALGQRWGMFESIPSKDGWYVARAKLKDGSEVDLLRQGARLNWSRPEFPAGMYPNHRWRKLFREMAYHDEQGYQVFRLPVAKFLCREWNARKPADKQIVKFEFIYCMERKAVAMNTSTPQIFGERLVQLDVNGS